MSQDDSSPGFLSKVVKFVRHPTTRWSDLDVSSSDGDSEYSKAALKEMVERKRRNDFVRKREFEMLRKIRSREATVEGEQGLRPSFFHSSLPSKIDDRATTLKKIDEIEAQMSMQWWKPKGQDSLTSTGSGRPSGAPGTPAVPSPERKAAQAKRDALVEKIKRRKAQYSATESAPLQHADPRGKATKPSPSPTSSRPSGTTISTLRDPFPTTRRGTEAVAAAKVRTGLMALTDRRAPSGATAAAPPGAAAAHSASSIYALDVHEIVQDPGVEEAAIRFANGDDAGAEQGLKESIADGGSRENQLEDWLALFDLYRATGQLEPFDKLMIDFVNRFGRSAPPWCDMPALVAAMAEKSPQPIASTASKVAWTAGPELDAHAVGTLQSVLLHAPDPWVLDWSEIKAIDVKAARALLGVFKLWGDQDIELSFLGCPRLRALLKQLTPSGRRDIEQIWWDLRMAVLRVMNRPDEFELTALDFCVTYEVSPPGWERPLCRFQALSGGSAESAEGTSLLGDGVIERVPMGQPDDSAVEGPPTDFNQLGLVELSGEILGEPQSTLEDAAQRLQGSDVMIISCRHLIRVDFSAAGTLLNWVGGHHASGQLIQFVDVHRLVAAFFHVIGITEYAKVVVRND